MKVAIQTVKVVSYFLLKIILKWGNSQRNGKTLPGFCDWKVNISKFCCYRFPQWAHGYWQHMYIEGNALTYKDHSTFKTFTIRCLGPDLGVGERFPVFARTQW
jgi:hypothetical protein